MLIKRFEFENYIFMLVLYLLCFVYLYYLNTEYICIILLIFLNLFYLLLFYNDIDDYSTVKLFLFVPLEFPVRIIILIWWVLLIISNSWLINTMSILRKKFIHKETGINLGKKSNYMTKNYLLASLICGTILFWVLHLSSTQNTQRLIPKFSGSPSINTVNVIVISLGIVIISVSLFLNDQLTSNTKIITTQKT